MSDRTAQPTFKPLKGLTLAIHKVNADCFRSAVKSVAMHYKCRISNEQPNNEDPEMIDIKVMAGGGTREQNRYLFEIGKHYAMEVMSKKNL